MNRTEANPLIAGGQGRSAREIEQTAWWFWIVFLIGLIVAVVLT